MLALVLRYWKPLAIGFALLAVFSWHKLAVHNAFNAGRKAEQEAARILAGKRIIEMERNNEAFRKLPARDRCIAFMRDSGLPEKECD